jgi:hypothetical protein
MIRKPVPKPVSYIGPPPRPIRRAIVAFRDNQARRKEQPQDIKKNPVTVLDLAAVEPLKAAKHCQADISAATGGFQKEMRRHMAVAYAVARALQNNREAWRSFVDDDFWQQRKKRPTIEDRTGPLLHVMVFVFNAIDRNSYKRASKYAAGLKQYWRHNVPAHEVAAKIEEDGGIEALSQASAESKPKKSKPGNSSKLTFSATEGRTGSLLALSEGQEARLIIRRVTGERGVVARIVRFDPVKA